MTPPMLSNSVIMRPIRTRSSSRSALPCSESCTSLNSRPSAGGKNPCRKPFEARRKVLYAGARERVEARVYDRTFLLSGNAIEGPALIDEHASTTVIGPLSDLR